MSDEQATMQIRSFRVCFDLERRLHKIDNWRIPLPYGLPLRSIAYFGVALVAVLVLWSLPLTGEVLGILHPAIRFLLLPAGAAYALTQWRVDGRLPHAAGIAWLRMKLGPKRLAAFRPAPELGPAELGTVTLAPDERSARMRKGVVEGPARVVIRYPAELRPRGKTLHVRQRDTRPLWRGKQVNLKPGQRVVVE